MEEVNWYNRPISTQGESTSKQLTESNDTQMFQFDEEMDILMQNLDSQKLRMNPSLRLSVIEMLSLSDGHAHGECSSDFNIAHKNVCARCHLPNKSSFEFGCFYFC